MLKKSGKNDLNSVLSNDKGANAYFMSLPEHVQGAILQRATEISSEEDIRNIADSVINGEF